MKIILNLKKTELEQLLQYCKWAKRSGDYYGNKEYFWKRHNKIVEELIKVSPSKGEDR